MLALFFCCRLRGCCVAAVCLGAGWFRGAVNFRHSSRAAGTNRSQSGETGGQLRSKASRVPDSRARSILFGTSQRET